MEKTAELKPCPFCGKPGPHLYQAGGYWRIKCIDGCSVQITGYYDKVKCVEDWNRRPRENPDMTTADMLEKFPPGMVIKIWKVLPGEYKVGYIDREHTYVPGFGSYYPLAEAIDKCLVAYQNNQPSNNQMHLTAATQRGVGVPSQPSTDNAEVTCPPRSGK